MNVTSSWLGCVDIKQAFQFQTEFLNENTLNEVKVYGAEHFEVLSVGRSLWSSDLTFLKTSFESIDFTLRGGKLTLHNPGQLIIYPLLNLKTCRLTLKQYISLILSVTEKTLIGLDSTLKSGSNSRIQTNCKENIGIYIDQKKLMSLGLNHKRGWVSHGLSINVNNNLEKFKLFDVCGHAHTEVTSLENLKIRTSTQELFKLWLENFNKSINKPL